MKKLCNLLAFCLLASCAWTQNTLSGTLTGTDCLTMPTGNRATVLVQVSGGSWTGTIQPNVNTNGKPASPVGVTSTVAGSASQATITANGTYWATVTGSDNFQVCGATVTNTASITMNATNLSARNGSGGGSGSVTSLTQGGGIALTPNPISATGTIATNFGGSLNAFVSDNGSGIPQETAAPTSPNGVTQIWTTTPSGGNSAQTAASFAGVPVDATNPVTLLVTDRANFLDWTSGSALAIPANTGNFASNFPFVLRNTSGGDLTVTPSGANIDGAATTVIHSAYSEFVYNDNTNWKGLKFATAATDGSFTFQVPTNGTNPILTLTGNTQSNGVTAPPLLNGTATWNNAALVGQGINLAVTNTTSSATSTLLNLMGGAAGATPEFVVTATGVTQATNLSESAQGFSGTLNSTAVQVCSGVCTTSANGAAPTLTIQGEDNSNTGASTGAGAVIVRGGNLTSTPTNKSGPDVTISAGLGTGNAAASHVFVKSPALSQTSGTTQETQVTRIVTHVKAGSTTTATATNMFNVALANNQTAGAMVFVHVETTQATPHNCSTTGLFFFVAQDTGGTITQQTQIIAATPATICDTGTLTMTATASGAAPTVFSVTPSWTTIVPSAVTITIQILNASQQDIALL